MEALAIENDGTASFSMQNVLETVRRYTFEMLYVISLESSMHKNVFLAVNLIELVQLAALFFPDRNSFVPWNSNDSSAIASIVRHCDEVNFLAPPIVMRR